MTTTVSAGGVSRAVVVVDYQARRTAQASVHDILGRADPVVVTTGGLSLRVGTITYRARTLAAAVAVADLHAAGTAATLTASDAPGLGMTYQASDVTVNPVERLRDGWAYTVTVAFVEVT